MMGKFIISRGKSDTNAHGPKFTALQSTWQIVRLGLPYGIEKRNLWGWRLWIYWKDGSTMHFDLAYWNGKQRGWEFRP